MSELRVVRGEPVDVDCTAKALHTSRRSLQRQLALRELQANATHLARAVLRWTGVAPKRHRGGYRSK